MSLTEHRVFFGTVNYGNPNLSTMFSGFPFRIEDEPTPEFLNLLLGPMSLDKVVEIYWRYKTVTISFAGNASVEYKPSGAASGDRTLEPSIAVSPVNLSRSYASVERDLVDHVLPLSNIWDAIGGNGVDDSDTFACSAIDPENPEPQEYHATANYRASLTLGRAIKRYVDHPSFPNSYFIPCRVFAEIFLGVATGGACGIENNERWIRVEGPYEEGSIPVDDDHSVLDATIFGIPVKCAREEVPDWVIGYPNSLSGLDSLIVSPSEWWPYANSQGLPVYNIATGERLRDPRS